MTFVPTFPLYPILADAITKTRKLTGSSNSFQITDQMIVKAMHSFYAYDLPAKFRSLKLKDKYTFTTNAGQDVYSFNSELYTTVNHPCYCDKREIKLFTNPANFYGVEFNWQFQNIFAFGNGTTGPYSGFTTAKPMIASVNNDPGPQNNRNLYFPQSRVQNLLISANTTTFADTQNVTDDGKGNLIQIFQTTSTDQQQEFGWTYYRQYASVDPTMATATINYFTGEISNLYFNEVIPDGFPIKISYNPHRWSRPLAIMFHQNQFTLRPVPGEGHTIELECYRQPIQALLAADLSGNPELSEWWEILAVGASKKIFEDRLDTDGVLYIDKMLRERYDIIETRTYAQIGQERIRTIYTDQLTHNYSLGGLGGGNGLT